MIWTLRTPTKVIQANGMASSTVTVDRGIWIGETDPARCRSLCLIVPPGSLPHV